MKMTDLPRLIILDVSHGNCSILQDTEGTIIVDCAHGDTLIETLRHLEISHIDRIMISHADQDHFKGFIDLLADQSITVKHVHINPDKVKNTLVFTALNLAIKDAQTRMETSREFLNSDMTGQLDVGEVAIEVLFPSKNMLSGDKDLKGRNLTSNSVSAVIRLVYKSRGAALLTADIDQVGLDNLLTTHSKIEADVLIFPHHGGNVGVGREKDNQDFTASLCSQVKPKLVLFSTGRDKHNNPRKEIVKTVLQTIPDVHIMCTQLAKSCSSDILAITPIHLTSLPSKGKESNHCCGGTVVINLKETATTYDPDSDHKLFVKNHVVSALCK